MYLENDKADRVWRGNTTRHLALTEDQIVIGNFRIARPEVDHNIDLLYVST
jgi:hypothetical protein